MQTLQAVLFDLDDTLYPEREFVLSGFRAVASWSERRFGIPADTSLPQLTRLYEDGIRFKTFDMWLAAHHSGTSVPIADLVRVYREHTPVLHPFPDTMRTLETLRGRYRLGLLTDGVRAVQEKKVAALGIARYFQTITYSDALGRDAWKPSPTPYRATLQALQVEPEAAVYVGDNPAKDFLGARRAGMRSIRIRRLQCEHTDAEYPSQDHVPDCSIVTLDELPAALHRMEQMNTETP